MVTFSRIPDDESARQWREHGARLAASHPEPAPLPANVLAAMSLAVAGHLLFRARAYLVPPIPWREGVRLAQLDQQRREYAAHAQDPATAEPYAAACAAIAEVAWRVVRPRTALGRLARSLGLHRNPFRNASEEELGELLDFLLLCRTRSLARRRLEMEGPDGPWM